jgi:hypothetical protein
MDFKNEYLQLFGVSVFLTVVMLFYAFINGCSSVNSASLQNEIQVCSTSCSRGQMKSYQACKCKEVEK